MSEDASKAEPTRGSFSQIQHPSAQETPMTLDSFDLSTFNPADPAAWTSLAKVWQASTGMEPNQFLLMQWVQTKMMGGGANIAPQGSEQGGQVGYGQSNNGGGGYGNQGGQQW